MGGATTVAWTFTVLFVAIAAYTTARLRTSGLPNRRADASHLVMGLGMAVVFCPLGDPVPREALVAVFTILGAVMLLAQVYELRSREARAAVRRREPPGEHGNHGFHHAAASLTMVYMLTQMASGSSMGLPAGVTAMAGMPGMAGMAGAAIPAVTMLLIAYSWGYALVRGIRLSRLLATVPTVTGGGSFTTSVLAAPALSGVCDVVMSLGMGYMLLMAV